VARGVWGTAGHIALLLRKSSGAKLGREQPPLASGWLRRGGKAQELRRWWCVIRLQGTQDGEGVPGLLQVAQAATQCADVQRCPVQAELCSCFYVGARHLVVRVFPGQTTSPFAAHDHRVGGDGDVAGAGA